ncbi:MAG: MFS transporter, partial [Methylococcaceae bacterium]|nr:MFS transporter [Methylococcaceae bacterium]
MTIPYWRLSGFYCFYFASLGGLLPFWSLYLEALGFNALEIGELSALLVGTKMIAPNIWGWIADHTGKSLRLIRVALFFAALFFLGFLGVKHYLGFALVTILFSFFWNAALPQFEVATLLHIQTEPLRYAKIRLWGSIGFIAAVLGIGRLLDYQPIRILPLVISGLLAITWLITLTTPEAEADKPIQADQGIWRIVFTAEVLAFLAVYLLLQIAHSPYYVFFSIYLKQYGYSASIIGFLWALGVIAEIGLFMLMRRLLQWISLRRILLVSIFLSAVRWLLIARYADLLWVILIAQLLHAATFASVHVVAMHLIQQYFGVHHQGKGQALYTSVSFGLGGVLGGYYSGYLWDFLGAERLFLLAACCCVGALVIALIW